MALWGKENERFNTLFVLHHDSVYKETKGEFAEHKKVTVWLTFKASS